MHSYPWKDVFFSLRASICSVRHCWKHHRNTSPPSNMCASVCRKSSSLRMCQSLLCGAVFSACRFVIWCDHRLQSGPWWWAHNPHIHFHRAPQILTSNRNLTKKMRAFQPGQIAASYLWYLAFQTRAEQPGENLYKQTQCDYECITIQQTGNQHQITCHATLQN